MRSRSLLLFCDYGIAMTRQSKSQSFFHEPSKIGVSLSQNAVEQSISISGCSSPPVCPPDFRSPLLIFSLLTQKIQILFQPSSCIISISDMAGRMWNVCDGSVCRVTFYVSCFSKCKCNHGCSFPFLARDHTNS